VLSASMDGNAPSARSAEAVAYASMDDGGPGAKSVVAVASVSMDGNAPSARNADGRALRSASAVVQTGASVLS
jgi:hypothetical protein